MMSERLLVTRFFCLNLRHAPMMSKTDERSNFALVVLKMLSYPLLPTIKCATGIRGGLASRTHKNRLGH